jgi:hypothetical protein
MIDQYFAHTLPGKPPADRQEGTCSGSPQGTERVSGIEHLKETAEKVKTFADSFLAVHQMAKNAIKQIAR